MTLAALGWALLNRQSVFALVIFSWSVLGACFLPLILLLLWRVQVSALQALMLMLVGAGSVLLWHFFGADVALNGADVYQGLPALIASLVLIVIYMLWHRLRQPESELSKY